MSAAFSSFGLAEPLLRGISAYAAPTPIQEAVIPAILRGGDVRASAQTGSGKTAAFALPILQRLYEQHRERTSERRRIRALILTPTRELAVQVAESFRSYARYFPTPVKTDAVFGGVSVNPQMMALRGGADVIVATPGRLLDLLERNALSLTQVETLVLDEADRLLALGFAEELARVLAALPLRRQNVLISATFPPAVLQLAESVLRDPQRIEMSSDPATAPAITHRAIEVDLPRRTQLLRHLIQENAWSRVLVFVATKYATGHVAQKLRGNGIPASGFAGDLSQGARTQALSDFKAGRIRVLVATDVAARGIDIAELPVVVNYDLPRSAVDYLHRVGRTGRAGESGLAVSFITAASHAHFGLIEKRQGMQVEREQIPGFEPTETPPPASTGGIKGRRKSKKDKLREAAARRLPPVNSILG